MTEHDSEVPGLSRTRVSNTASYEATDKQHRKTSTVRAGRPSRELADQVDERILDAARHVFLDRGLGGASINQIARLAHAGKGTIYAHFSARSPMKEALFEAVMSRTAALWTDAFKIHAPIGTTPEKQLVDFAKEILTNLLSSGTIDFARLCMAEAGQYPDLPRLVRTARQHGADVIVQALSEVAQGDEFDALPALAPERLPTTTQYFLDLV